MGIATESIKLATQYSLVHLGLRHLTADAYPANLGSLKEFQNAGFVIEGVRKNRSPNGTPAVDSVLMGITRNAPAPGAHV